MPTLHKEQLTEKVKARAFELGVDLVGIANVERWGHAPKKLRPQAHLPEAKSVIAISIHHPDASVEWGGLPNSNYSGPFQLGMIPKLDTISWRLTNYLEKLGFSSIPFSCTGFWRHRPYKDIESTNTASFSHRHAFVAAGLGEFGWNNMAMSYKYGPRNRLVSVITSASLKPDALYDGPPLCDRCRMCESKCPGRNYKEELLLEPGYDELEIEGKKYCYAKLDRYRCLWGEQFALDMEELHKEKRLTEKKLYEVIKKGVPRLGGEFGNCFRFCMSKPVRYWDKKYTSAPRRTKEKSQIDTNVILKRIKALAIESGADRICIQPLNVFSKIRGGFPDGYPVENFFENFNWIITLGRTLPNFPKSTDTVINDNQKFLSVTTKVRVGVGAMDIARYIDDLGYEATQDWTEINNHAAAKAGWDIDENDRKFVSLDAPSIAFLSPPESLSCLIIVNSTIIRGYCQEKRQEKGQENKRWEISSKTGIFRQTFLFSGNSFILIHHRLSQFHLLFRGAQVIEEWLNDDGDLRRFRRGTEGMFFRYPKGHRQFI